MKQTFFFTAVSALALAVPAAGPSAPLAVQESARGIPVYREVDVLVVGGTCGAVAAAEAAAKAGATVFLAAPRPYLGDDLAGTLRLWPEAGESPATPLAKALFIERESSLPFTYKADAPSGGKHVDTGDMLCDGRSDDMQHHTVEFAGDVAILADLGGCKPVAGVELTAFKRAGDFEIGSAHLSVSADGKTWSKAIPLEPSDTEEPNKVHYVAALNQKLSHVKVAVKMKKKNKNFKPK